MTRKAKSQLQYGQLKQIVFEDDVLAINGPTITYPVGVEDAAHLSLGRRPRPQLHGAQALKVRLNLRLKRAFSPGL